MDSRAARQGTAPDPPDTDLEYYSRPENYKGSNLDNLTSFLFAKSRQGSRPIEVRRKHKKRSKTWELFQRYRHILTPDLCDTPSSSSSSSPVTSDEEEDSIKNDYYENIDYYQTQSGNHTRDNGREHVQRSGLVRVPQLGVDDELSPESRATSPAHADRHESGYGSRMARDASLGEGFRREQSNISHDQVLWRSYGASLDVRVPDRRGRSPDSLRPVTRSGVPDSRMRSPDCLRPVTRSGVTDRRMRSPDCLRPVTRSGASSARRSRAGSRSSSAKSTMSTFSRELRRVMCLQKFKRVTLAVVNVLKLAKVIIKRTDSPSALLKTFTALSREPEKEEESENMKNYGLQFDLSYFRANKEITISSEVKHILRLPPSHRTPEQIQTAMFGLQSLPSFAEYPLHMQEKLTKVAWHEIVTPQRTIIRQGHFAENFYFILSGQAVVTIHKPGETSAQTAAIMRKGTSFGELALLHHSRRTATVTSHDTVQLLSVGREDFFDIFMSGQRKGEVPEHIQFISQLDFMKDWPLERLLERPDQCLLHFFKRNTVIVRDSKVSEWFYVVKSGSCQVLKQLKRVNASLGPLRGPSMGARGSRARHRTATWHQELPRAAGRQLRGKPQSRELTQNAPTDGKENLGNHVKDKQQPQLPVFVQIELLKPKDVFGLELINSNLNASPTSVSLVSLGAECVMLSKAFFIRHASDSLRKRLAEVIQSYPDEETLQDSLQTKVNWELYKRSLILQVAAHKQPHV